jgi:hypothetical protein
LFRKRLERQKQSKLQLVKVALRQTLQSFHVKKISAKNGKVGE